MTAKSKGYLENPLYDDNPRRDMSELDHDIARTTQLLSKYGGRLHEGGALPTKVEMQDAGDSDGVQVEEYDDEDYDVSDEEDDLYDSKIEQKDELKTIRETLEHINRRDPNAYQ